MSINLMTHPVTNQPKSFTQGLNKGFTLVELLMVILLMGVMAMTTLAVVTDEDDQQRYDATKTYLQLIKKAIVGNENVTLNGETEVSGFVADMGRLPACLRELVQDFDCDVDISDGFDPATESRLPAWQQDVDSGVWGGWRGPYLQGMPESSGLTFRDGWKNQGPVDATANADINYGWLFGTGAADGIACNDANISTDVSQQLPNSIVVQSCGSNATVNIADTNYALDYPALTDSAGNVTVPLLVNAYDTQVELGELWGDVAIKLNKGDGAEFNLPAGELRAKLNYPIDGFFLNWSDVAIDDAAKRDAAPFLSLTFPDAITKVPTVNGDVDVSSGDKVTFPVGSVYDPATLTVTATSGDVVFNEGTATTADDSQLRLTNCPCVLLASFDTPLSSLEPYFPTTPTPPDTSTTLIVGSNSGKINFPSKHVAPLSADFIKPYIIVPVGSSVNLVSNQITLPQGATLSFANPINNEYFPKIMMSGNTVTVSETLTLNNTVAVTDVSFDQFLVPTGTTVSGTTLTVEASNAVPIGQMSISVVCEVGGELFNGDCATTTLPIASAYQLKVLPRRSLQPPSDLTWNLP